VYTADGRIGSGKTTRRFRRIDGLLASRARLDLPRVPGPAQVVPVVVLPDGREYSADDPQASHALSTILHQPVQLRTEAAVPHHDESPVHLITTSAVRQLERLLGETVNPARFRANLVLEAGGTRFVDDQWRERHLAIGAEVILCLGPGMPRCAMVGVAQPHESLDPDGRLLALLGQVHGLRFGRQASVARPGVVRQGDRAYLIPVPEDR
jgi:uncharacterized protein YcbX